MTGKAACAALLVAALWATTAAAQDTFAARLSTVPIDTRTQAQTTGSGHATAMLDGNRLTIEGSFEGLQGAATVAWLHQGLATGVRGEPIHELTVTQAPAGQVSATVRLSNREVTALRAGRLYLQIHSETAPDGNLWGWLLEK